MRKTREFSKYCFSKYRLFRVEKLKISFDMQKCTQTKFRCMFHSKKTARGRHTLLDWKPFESTTEVLVRFYVPYPFAYVTWFLNSSKYANADIYIRRRLSNYHNRRRSEYAKVENATMITNTRTTRVRCCIQYVLGWSRYHFVSYMEIMLLCCRLY